MRVRLTRRAARDFESLPPDIQTRLKKHLDLLRTDLATRPYEPRSTMRAGISGRGG